MKKNALEELAVLVDKAARTIEHLRAELAAQSERIRQLEQIDFETRLAAARFARMKAQLAGLPEACGGFSARGTVYATFEEAFDAEYPPAPPEPASANLPEPASDDPSSPR